MNRLLDESAVFAFSWCPIDVASIGARLTETLQAGQPAADHHVNAVAYWFGTPWLPGAVTWFGTIITLVGFIITIWQLRTATKASEAARDAAQDAAKRIGVHEFSAKLTTTVEHLRSAQELMRRRNPDGAAAYLHVAWTAMIEAQNLAEAEADSSELVALTQQARKLLEEASAPLPDDGIAATADRLRPGIDPIIVGIGTMAGRVRMQVSGLGMQKQ